MVNKDFNKSDLIANRSFHRWVRGEATVEEKEFWDEWVNSKKSNRHLAIEAQEELTGFSIQPAESPDTQKAWNSFYQKLQFETGSAVSRAGRSSGNLTRIKKWAGIAAGLLLLVAVSVSLYLYSHQQKNGVQQKVIQQTVTTDYGEQKQIALSDGSTIILNAHSTIVYTINREELMDIKVTLDGEAYFSVAKRDGPGDSAFRVRTADGIVRVLGTQFAVSTRNEQTRVVLREGQVAIHSFKKRRGNGLGKTILKPNELAEFDQSTDVVSVKKISNIQVYTSWITRTLIFDETPVETIFNRLKHTFGVNIIVRDDDLYQRKISGSIENADLRTITSALSHALSVPIKVSNQTVYVGSPIED